MTFESPAQVFVGHLNSTTSLREFERRFNRYGRMKRCELKKGYGFVEYDDIRSAEDAIKYENDTSFRGNRIVVEWAKCTNRYTRKSRGSSHRKDQYTSHSTQRRQSPKYSRYHRRRSTSSSVQTKSHSQSPSRSRSRSRSKSRSTSKSYRHN